RLEIRHLVDGAAADDDDIVSRPEPGVVAAERLAGEPLEAIALHGLAAALAGDDGVAVAGRVEVVGEHAGHERSVRRGLPPGSDPADVAFPVEPELSCDHGTRCLTWPTPCKTKRGPETFRFADTAPLPSCRRR